MYSNNPYRIFKSKRKGSLIKASLKLTKAIVHKKMDRRNFRIWSKWLKLRQKLITVWKSLKICLIANDLFAQPILYNFILPFHSFLIIKKQNLPLEFQFPFWRPTFLIYFSQFFLYLFETYFLSQNQRILQKVGINRIYSQHQYSFNGCAYDSNNKQKQGLQQEHENKQIMTNNNQADTFDHTHHIQLKMPQQPQYTDLSNCEKQQFQLVPHIFSQDHGNDSAPQQNQKANQQIIAHQTVNRRNYQSELQDSDVSDQTSSDEQYIVENAYVITQQINYKKIQIQIVELSVLCQKEIQSAWKQIKPFVKCLQKIAYQHRMRLDLIGSLATQLWLPYSDIDFILCPIEESNMNNDIQFVIQMVYNKLKFRKSDLEISEIYFNQCHMFPTIKLQMTARYSHRKIDLAIYHKNNNGKKYVNYILQVLSSYPMIKPLFYFLRKVSQNWKLHDQKKGGLKSYALFLMVSFIVQSYPANSLSQHLLNIATYYGFYFEYSYSYDQNYQKDFEKFKKAMQIGSKPKNFGLEMKFSLIDPLNHFNNVGGKKTQTLKVQNMFKNIYYSMHLSLIQKEHQKLLPYLNSFSLLFASNE